MGGLHGARAQAGLGDVTSASGQTVESGIGLEVVDAWWRAANYLTVGQIYLMDNPLLREPLAAAHIKPRLLGHWGTSPALNFTWAHLNRVIREREVQTLFVCGPGHGGPAMVASAYLDGTYSELFPDVGADRAGLRALMRQFSFPGGIPSHDAPNVPGSINEGGELGYSLMHAYGAALDNPDLVVACVIGDGEAETGPLAASWHANKLMNAATDGAVLPIINLNGYKIANPTILARIGDDELTSLLRGYGHEPIFVDGGLDEDHPAVHQKMARALDDAYDRIEANQRAARDDGVTERPVWPVIVLRTPKGWTGPREVDGVQVEGTFHAHQVPLGETKTNEAHREQLEQWMKSYRPEELFDDEGRIVDLVTALRPTGHMRMSATPFANGGELLTSLELPDWRGHGVVSDDHTTLAEATKQLGGWLADLIRNNPSNFRLFGPDETVSNRLQDVFESTQRQWDAAVVPTDEHLAPSGRLIELLSEHVLQGMLEGYLLTGRHGLLNSYEAFVHIVDSMFNQHAKWIESASTVPWRRPIASLNYLLSSHVWRQDHNGFSHQDPGFMNVVVNKRAELVRIYLPADANTLLATAHHVFSTRDRVNVVICGKQEQPTWLSPDAAAQHRRAGIGVWDWAGTDDGSGDPDVVMACAGDVPTLETIAAAQILRNEIPDLSVRVVNVLDLMRLQSRDVHPHGLDDPAFDALFTVDAPVIFAFHGYPSLVHQLTYSRANDKNIHVRGFAERGSTTTPFDMVHLNDLDRFRLALDVIHRVPGLAESQAELAESLHRQRDEARAYAYEHGEDPEHISAWRFER